MGANNNPVIFCKVNDDYNTPTIAFEFLLSKLAVVPKYIWAPFYFDGSLKSNLRNIGLVDVTHEDENFFEYEPAQYDCIIDNCPFSKKKEVLERCMLLKKPFALLLPIDTL